MITNQTGDETEVNKDRTRANIGFGLSDRSWGADSIPSIRTTKIIRPNSLPNVIGWLIVYPKYFTLFSLANYHYLVNEL